MSTLSVAMTIPVSSLWGADRSRTYGEHRDRSWPVSDRPSDIPFRATSPHYVDDRFGPILLKNSPAADGVLEIVDESSILIVRSTKFRQKLTKFEVSASCPEFFNGIGREQTSVGQHQPGGLRENRSGDSEGPAHELSETQREQRRTPSSS